jgi:hypothetical protein
MVPPVNLQKQEFHDTKQYFTAPVWMLKEINESMPMDEPSCDAVSRFLLHIGTHLSDYKASHPKRLCHENLKSHTQHQYLY